MNYDINIRVVHKNISSYNLIINKKKDSMIPNICFSNLSGFYSSI